MDSNFLKKIETYSFTPSTIESLSGVSTEAQRDWRHKGFLTNYGASNEAGRFKYSFRDAVAFWLGDRLIRSGWDRRTCLALAWTNAPSAIELIRGGEATRYIAHLFDGDSEDCALSGWTVAYADDLTAFADMPYEKMDVVDLVQVCTRAPRGIREVALDIEEMFA